MSLARGVVISALGNFVPPLAALAIQPILANALGVNGRGTAAAATAPLLLSIVVLSLGIPESLTHFVARRAPRIRALLWRTTLALAVSGVIGMAATVVFSEPLSGSNRQLAELMVIASGALIPALITASMRGMAAGLQAWTLIAIERGASALARLIAIAILAATNSLDVMTATLAISLTTFIGGFAYIRLLWHRRHPLSAGQDSTQNLPRFPFYAAQVWLGAAAGILYSRLDQVLITPLAGVYELGIYVVAASIAEVVLLINIAIRDVIFSVESETPNDTRAAQAARVSTLVTFAFGVLLAIAAPFAIPFFFGDAFEEAVLPTAILISAAILGNPGSVAGAILSGRGRPGLRSLSLAIGLIVNAAAVFALVPSMGAIGAAYATLIASALAGNNLNILWLKLCYNQRAVDYLVIHRQDVSLVFKLARRLLWRD